MGPMVVGAIASSGLGSKVGQLAGTIGNAAASLIGGTPKVAKYSPTFTAASIAAMLANASAAQMEWLRSTAWPLVADGRPFPSSAGALYESASGGSDKIITSSRGIQFAQALESLIAAQANGTAEAAVGGASTNTSAAGNGTSRPQGTGINGALQSIGQSITQTIKNIFGATVMGAVEGAQSASQGAETGSAAGAALSNTKATLTIVAVALVVLVIVYYTVIRKGK